MRISLDFDGVLSHTMKSWVNNCNILDNNVPEITLKDIDRWAFFEKWGMEWPEALEIFKMCWTDTDNLDPMEHDLAQKVRLLKKLGTVDVVTSVDPICKHFIEYWLIRKGIEYDGLRFVSIKEELDYDVFIDDSPVNAMKIFNAGKDVLLYNQPWNRNIPNSFCTDKGTGEEWSITRVYNLYHAIDVIRSKYEEK